MRRTRDRNLGPKSRPDLIQVEVRREKGLVECLRFSCRNAHSLGGVLEKSRFTQEAPSGSTEGEVHAHKAGEGPGRGGVRPVRGSETDQAERDRRALPICRVGIGKRFPVVMFIEFFALFLSGRASSARSNGNVMVLFVSSFARFLTEKGRKRISRFFQRLKTAR